MNLKAIIIIFAIIFVIFAGGCAEKPSTQNSGPDQNINYGLVPPYFTLLSSPGNIKPEDPARPVIRDEGEEINKILEAKGYFYVCGDAANMAREVNDILGQIIADQRGVTKEKGDAVVKAMRTSGAYQEDVWS